METDNEEKKDWTDRLQERLTKCWNNLSLLQQRIVLFAALVLLETLLAYCCWVAEMRGQSASVVRIGSLRVAAITGVFVCVFPNALLIFRLMEKASTKLRAFGKRLTIPLQRTASLVTQHIPPLTQAHGYYTVGRDTEAQELTEQMLAREPENVTAQELLQLIEARQAHRKPEPEAKPGLTDKVLDSKYASIAANVLFALGVASSFAGCVYYTHVGFTQGWTAIVSQGLDKYGNWRATRVWHAAGFLAILPTGVLVYGLFRYFPEQMYALLEKGVNRCLTMSDWGKSRPSAIRNFADRMVRSTPSRSSEPKASLVSRPSSTTRARPRR